MADYISALTGEQMDDALEQMNQRLPEQWTTGQIDGNDVPPTNPRYHNNAKHYAQEAKQSSTEITGMTATAHALPAGSDPTVTKTGGGNEPFNLDFGIPAGNRTYITATEYQAGVSGTMAPTGTWSESIPVVPQGQYLWTRYTWNDGTATYQVTRQGIDGTGAGDMVQADYDPDLVVISAGGITEYTVMKATNSVTPFAIGVDADGLFFKFEED